MSANLVESLRVALIANASLTALLDAYEGSFPIFTRRPVPADAPYPMVLVSPDIVQKNEDGVADERPLISRDITVYGQNDTSAHYRTVEDIGHIIHGMFHRNRKAITVVGWNVVSISAMGPQIAPTDDDKTVARVVMLTILLART